MNSAKSINNFFTSFAFVIAILSTNFVNSQNIDEKFLESLPDDLKNEVIFGNKDDKDEELNNLLNSDSSVEKEQAQLKNLSDQLEALKLKSGLVKKPYELERFGDSFFNDFQSTFMPVNVANLGADYVIDVGDVLLVNIVGKLSDEFEVTVNRDGAIMVPNVGKLSLAGKTYGEAQKSFDIFLEQNVLGVDGDLSLSKLRDIQVLMLGYVYKPGIYTLSGGSNILGALKAAGGIGSKGSFRKITQLRNGEVIQTFDLYDILIDGKFNFTKPLRSGDSILIDAMDTSIPISGGVNRPAIYEILEGESISELIEFAGGFSESFIGFDHIFIKKSDSDNFDEKKIYLSNIPSYKLSKRDQIMVPYFTEDLITAKKVSIKGWVNNPGEYYISDQDTFSSLIKKAGGFKSGAYLYGISLFRKDAISKETSFNVLEYSKSINYLVTSIGQPGTVIPPNAIEYLSNALESRRSTGRIINDFNQNVDIELHDSDEIVVPNLQKTVYLFGEFNNPVSATYNSVHTITDYIKIGGGLSKNATDEIIVIDPDGAANVFKKGSFITALTQDRIEIYPGSIIYAPRDIGSLSGIRYASTVAPILSSLALSLASLNSINN